MSKPERIEKSGTYEHPDTGEKVEIPAGSLIVRVGDEVETMFGPLPVGADGSDGEVLYWHNPPVTPEGELHPDQDPEYEPLFDRSGARRRLLMHVTDEVDVTATEQNATARLVPIEALGPRNTPEALAYALARDPASPSFQPRFDEALARVFDLLGDLDAAGLVKRRDDGSYALTGAGWHELRN